MSRKKLRWQDAALHDIEETHAFLLQRNPVAAQRFATSILEATERLQEHPEIGPVAWDLRPSGRFRGLVCGHHRLIYRIEGEIVWLLRIWDTRQDPQRLKV